MQFGQRNSLNNLNNNFVKLFRKCTFLQHTAFINTWFSLIRVDSLIGDKCLSTKIHDSIYIYIKDKHVVFPIRNELLALIFCTEEVFKFIGHQRLLSHFNMKVIWFYHNQSQYAKPPDIIDIFTYSLTTMLLYGEFGTPFLL